MKRIKLSLFVLLLYVPIILLLLSSSSPSMITPKRSLKDGDIDWEQTYWSPESGYPSDQIEVGYSGIKTADGGYAIAALAYGYSPARNWIIKTDSTGDPIWNVTYVKTGGDNNPQTIIQTTDGGYLLLVWIDSLTLTDRNGWLIKTDSNGNHEWNKTYGESVEVIPNALIQTSDGGYAIAGDIRPSPVGPYQFWLVKLNATGSIEWEYDYGYSGEYAGTWEEAGLVQSSDDGYYLAGYRDVSGKSEDGWLLKTDSNGNHEWNQTYGGTNTDWFGPLINVTDGFITVGYTESNDLSGEYWLFKTDNSGNHEWNQTYGPTDSGTPKAFIKTSDGGFAVAGLSFFYDSDGDAWVLKTGSNGDHEWNQTYGGTGLGFFEGMVETSDQGFVLCGVTNASATDFDVWLVKTVAGSAVPEFHFPTIIMTAIPILGPVVVFSLLVKNKRKK